MNKSARQTLLDSKRAAIFARARLVPNDPDHNAVHLKTQVTTCREVATRLGAEVVAEYRVMAGTTDPAMRPVLDRMLDQVRVCGADYLVVQGCDRFTRKPAELIRIALWLKNAGTHLVTTDGPESSFLQAVFDAQSVAISFDGERRSA